MDWSVLCQKDGALWDVPHPLKDFRIYQSNTIKVRKRVQANSYGIRKLATGNPLRLNGVTSEIPKCTIVCSHIGLVTSEKIFFNILIKNLAKFFICYDQTLGQPPHLIKLTNPRQKLDGRVVNRWNKKSLAQTPEPETGTDITALSLDSYVL